MPHLVRAGDEHLHLMRTFRCTAHSGRFGAADVEAQVRRGKFVRRASMNGDERFLVLTGSDNLVGCSYHADHPELALQRDAGARFLVGLALSDEWQGRRVENGMRASDVLLAGTLDDIRDQYPGCRYVSARIHRENKRSLALFERSGFGLLWDHKRYPFYVAVL